MDYSSLQLSYTVILGCIHFLLQADFFMHINEKKIKAGDNIWYENLLKGLRRTWE